MQALLITALVVSSTSAAPSKQGFASTVNDSSPGCQSAIASLPAELTTCYSDTSLYFSTPSQICTDNCLSPTIKGAHTVSNACKGAQSNLPGYGVYVDWSNGNAAHAACAKASNNKYCLEFIASVMVTADTILLLGKTPTAEDIEKLGCHEECAKKLYQTVDGNGSNAPSLYYYGNTRMSKLFEVWKAHCGWV